MINVENTTPPMTDESIKEATGRTWNEWFELLDKRGGPQLGRREIGNFLYSELNKNDWWAATLVVEYENARGVVKKDGKPQGYTICITKTISVPIQDVFKAFSSPIEMDKWFSKGTKMEFSAGSRYENEDGDSGEFIKVRENKDIKFTWEQPRHSPGSIVEIKFDAKSDSKCGIIVTHDRIQKREEADNLRQGWMYALAALKSYLESGFAISYEEWKE